MNYLAHLYLSKQDPLLRIGNFIADSVRGKDFSKFPNRVAEGIMLHRYIDTYTDQHPVVRQSKDLIRERYGHWSSVIVDIYYDHFLAANWNEYHQEPLDQYVAAFYADLEEYHNILPTRVKRFMPYMTEQNWLLNYASIAGISRIFYQMNQRTKGKSKMNLAPQDLVKHYDELEAQFKLFFADLMMYADQEYKKIS